MPSFHNFASFEKELTRLVATFEKNFAHYKKPGYDEASLRQEFLNPLFSALGWDVENKAGHIPQKREVEVESRTQIGGRAKRADYLFRTDGRERFVCEAKKPADDLGDRAAFQAKRYAWNKDLPLAVLTDFEGMVLYVVGGKPYADEPEAGEWKRWHFKQYPLVAQELWDLLSREKVAGGAIDTALDALPKKKSTGKGKAKQRWLIRPDRSRALDHDFLEFLDEARRDLASDLYKHNDHAALLEGNLLNESVQCILDRILFLRICEDRDIDTGTTLQNIVETWRRNYGHDEGRKFRQESMRLREDSTFDLDDDARSGGGGGTGGTGSGRIAAPRESLWYAIVRHFRALDRRPAGLTPFFNGNLFKPHGSEKLFVGDEWLAGFIGELSSDETPYLFNVIPVEILGSVYERFLGKVVVRRGTGIAVDEKPEVRKAGGVYYTPRYIVDYIVEQTVGKLLGGVVPEKSLALRILDPACGSGSFLIRAFERVCEHWQEWLTEDLRGALDCASPLALSDGAERRGGPGDPSRAHGEPSAAPPPATKRQRAGALQGAGTAPGARKTALAAWEKKHRKLCWVDAETGDIHLTVDLKRRILTENIYGVDLDSAAVEVTQLSLYLKMLENENRTTLQRERELFADEIALLPPLQDNIKCGNSLIASDFSMMSEDLVRVNAFDWDVQFRDIIKVGGFDAVIGNPPYIRIQTMQESNPAVVEHFKETYKSATRGNYDIYVVFIERVLGLLNKTGRLGYIVPHKFFNAQYGEPLRALLAEGQHLNEVVHFGDQQVFDGASTYTCLLFLTKVKSPEFVFRKAADLVAWREHKIADEGTVDATCASSADWNFVVGTKGSLFEKLKQIPLTLGLVSSGMFVGLQTSADTVFLFKDFREATKTTLEVFSKEANEWVRIEKAVLKRVIRSGSIGRYFAETTAYALFPYAVADNQARLYSQKELRDNFPHAWGHLLTHKKLLEDREKGAFKDSEWYRYGRTQNLGMWEQPKLLIPYMITELSAYDDRSDHFYFINVTTGGYGITLKEEFGSYRYICGLLNSRLLDFFLKQVSTNFRGGYFAANKQFIEQLPIRAIDFSNKADKAKHDKLVMLVEKMLALTPKLRAAKTEAEKATLQNAVSKTDQDIDTLVYELYALTPEEIALVEGGAP